MSLTASRPPGFSTRAISRNTAGLSAAKLMTQLLITQSTDASASGKLVDRRLVKLDVRATSRVPPGKRQHFVRHVDADRLAGRTNFVGRQKHVQAAAAAEIDDRLAGPQAGKRSRIAARQAPCWLPPESTPILPANIQTLPRPPSRHRGPSIVRSSPPIRIFHEPPARLSWCFLQPLLDTCLNLVPHSPKFFHRRFRVAHERGRIVKRPKHSIHHAGKDARTFLIRPVAHND